MSQVRKLRKSARKSRTTARLKENSRDTQRVQAESQLLNGRGWFANHHHLLLLTQVGAWKWRCSASQRLTAGPATDVAND
jgi:hypothetical protein